MRFDGIAFDYVYRLPQLLIPWFVLLPCVLAVDWRDDARSGESRLLAFVVGVTIVILSLGPKQRVFYLLPVIAPALLLIAAGTMRILSRQAAWVQARRAIAWLGPGYWGLVVTGLAILLTVAGDASSLPESLILRARALLVLLLVLAIAAVVTTRRKPDAIASIYSVAILFVVGFWTLGPSTQAWTKSRPGLAQLGRSAAMLTFPREEVFTWKVAPDPYVYHARLPVRVLRSEGEVLAELERFRRQEMVIIARSDEMSDLSPAIRGEMIGRPAAYKKRGLALYHVTAAPDVVRRVATSGGAPDSVQLRPGGPK